MPAFESERVHAAAVIMHACKPVGKERQKTMRCFGRGYLYTMYMYSVVTAWSKKLVETQKWRAELLESLDTTVTESFV